MLLGSEVITPSAVCSIIGTPTWQEFDSRTIVPEDAWEVDVNEIEFEDELGTAAMCVRRCSSRQPFVVNVAGRGDFAIVRRAQVSFLFYLTPNLTCL